MDRGRSSGMNPTILVVDHNEESLEILHRDMTRRYGLDYDVDRSL